jgi:CheY-like chemotaxis protein
MIAYPSTRQDFSVRQEQGLQPTDLWSLRQPGILIADDDPCIRSLLSFAFQANGFSVWLAENGREALDLYPPRADEIDFVLLDVCMPVLDGIQTFNLLLDFNPALRCCIMSGSIQDDEERQLLQDGALHVFRKPVRPAQIVRFFQEQAALPAVADSTAAPAAPEW